MARRDTSVAAQANYEWGRPEDDADALARLAAVRGGTANDLPAAEKARLVPLAPESGTRLVAPVSNPETEALQRLMDGIFLRADLVMGLRKKIDAMRTEDTTLVPEILLHAPEYKGLRAEVYGSLDPESRKINGVVRAMIKDAFMSDAQVHDERVAHHNRAVDDFYGELDPAQLKDSLKGNIRLS